MTDKSSASLFEAVLRDYYYGPMVEMLNTNMSEFWYQGPPVPDSWYIERGLPVPWRYVPPKWHVRKWRSLKWKIRSAREAVGFKIAGYRPEEDW